MTKRRWTDKEAVDFLVKRGVEIKEKNIIITQHLGGITAGGALDYLKNYCKYRVYVGDLKGKK